MTKRKALTLSIVIVMLLAMIFAVACDTNEEKDNVTKALEYAAKQTNLSLTLSSDGEVIYSYANGKTEDKYGLGIEAEEYLGEKGESGLMLKKEDFKEGYTFVYDSASQEAQLSGTLADAKALLSLDANDVNVSIKANLNSGVVSEYKLSYTSKNGYEVVISLV